MHEWIHLESKFLGLDNLFGSFKDLKSQVVNWRIGAQSQSQGPDPLKQFKAIKMISTDSFLKSEVVRKSTKWKPRDQARLALVAAAKFSETDDLALLELPRHDDPAVQWKDNSSARNYMRQASVYLNQSSEDYPIVIDSGASRSLTPNRNDFVGKIRAANVTELNGLSSTTRVEGVGMVQWTVRDVFGTVRTIKTTAYYVPSASIRLFSPQTYFQENDAGRFVMEARRTILTLADGSEIEFPYNPGSNLPLMLPAGSPSMVGMTWEDTAMLADGHSVGNYMSVAAEINQNLTASQKELLTWHWKLGHASLRWVQSLARDPQDSSRRMVLPTKHPKTSSCVRPM